MHIEAKAFISHKEKNHSYLGNLIKNELINTDLKMKSFLSEDAIEYGEHIPKKVLANLTEAELIFVIIDPQAAESKWVRWEYEFSQNRLVRTIVITHEEYESELRNIFWLNTYEKYLVYYRNDDALEMEIWKTVNKNRKALDQHACEKNKIKINARPDQEKYCEENIIRILGSVEGSIEGSVYLHIPCKEEDHPPIHSEDVDQPITLGSDGEFRLEFELPTLHGSASQPQTWFVEIKFGRKSKLIPILVYNKKNCNDQSIGTKQQQGSKYGKSSDLIQEAVVQRIDEQSKGTVESIPQKINNKVIARDDKVSELTTLLKQNDKIVITGDKGSGKSALLCQLYKKISKQQMTLFISCEQHLGVESLDQLNRGIIQNCDFLDYVEQLSSATKMVIIFDSLDTISRNEKAMNIFKHFLQIIWGTGKVKTISSVRKYDYEYMPNIANTDWGVPYHMGELSKNERNTILAEMGNPSISTELESILLNPLHLKLLSLIRERSPDTNFTNIKNEIELYDEHWKEYVLKQQCANSVRNVLYDIAHKMMLVQKTTISCDEFDDLETIHEILSRNIVLSDNLHDQIRFFHHAYLDYVASRFIITKHVEFVDFLLEDEYNVFLRPTIVFALSVLHQRNPEQAVTVIEKILTSQLKHFWKISALTALAKFDKSNPRCFEMLGRLLTKNPMLQRHFLMEINKQTNPIWYELWKDSFIFYWSASPSNPNSPFIVNYLEYVSEHTSDTEAIFKIIRSIVQNNKNSWSKRKAIEMSSIIDIESKTDWLLELSENPDSFIRTGVLNVLPKLIETYPEAVPGIFCNIFTFIELSTQVTQAASHGTFILNSTKKQDNMMIIWEAEKMFPKLLEYNSKQGIVATIKIFAKLQKNKIRASQTDVVDNNGNIRLESYGRTSDATKLIEHVIAHIAKCTNHELKELMPLFISVPFEPFRRIMINEMVKRKDEFATEIINEISDPTIFQIPTLRNSVKSAIQTVMPFLNKTQIATLLQNIMSLDSNHKQGTRIYNPDRIKTEFLSCFPAGALQSSHIELLATYQEDDPRDAPPTTGIKVQVGSKNVTKQQSPEEIISSCLGHKLGRAKKIDLLNAISDYLDKPTADLETQMLQRIKEFLIENKNDPDPNADDSQQDIGSILINYTIRGLVAKSLIKLLRHSNDHVLVPFITELSDDPINSVRSEVCSVLKYLFDYDYNLAHQIAKKYSVDDSVIVQFYLPAILNPIVDRHPEHAAYIIRNIIDKQTFEVADFLIELVFYYKDPNATALLNEIVDEKMFSPKIRTDIPFTLKQSWLFTDEFQDQSLELLYKLLDDPSNEVREKAAFFTLCSLEKDDITEHMGYLKKIRKHLKRISYESKREKVDPRLIEELLRFLGNFWHLLLEDAVEYLETTTSGKFIEYAKFQPVFVEESVKVLSGLFQHAALSKENRERCLDILDIYAEAGWPDALELLSAMERPD